MTSARLGRGENPNFRVAYYVESSLARLRIWRVSDMEAN